MPRNMKRVWHVEVNVRQVTMPTVELEKTLGDMDYSSGPNVVPFDRCSMLYGWEFSKQKYARQAAEKVEALRLPWVRGINIGWYYEEDL